MAARQRRQRSELRLHLTDSRGRMRRRLARCGRLAVGLAGGLVDAAALFGLLDLPTFVAAQRGVGMFVADVLLEVGALVERIERVVEPRPPVLLNRDALALRPRIDPDLDVERGDRAGVDADDAPRAAAARWLTWRRPRPARRSRPRRAASTSPAPCCAASCGPPRPGCASAAGPARCVSRAGC